MAQSAKDVLETELHVLDVCKELGSIVEANCHYTRLLAQCISLEGKTIEQLTVGDLLRINRDAADDFDRAERSE